MRRRAALASMVLAGCAFGGGAEDAALGDAARSDASPMDATADAGAQDTGGPDADPDDAGPSDVPPTGPRIQVGTGAIQFEPLVEGQIVELVAGPQGGGRYEGFHVWFGARSWELNPNAINVTFILLLASDRTELARLTWLTNFRPSEEPDAHEIWGGAPRISDCCAAVDQRLIMRVEVLDADGVSAAGEIEVVGEHECADLSTSHCM